MIDIYTNGIKRIYEEDLPAQKHYIKVVCEDVRGMSSDILLRNGAFFIANNDYLKLFFSYEISEPRYGYYDYDGNCLWLGRLVLPIRDLNNKIVGLIGYDPTQKMLREQLLAEGKDLNEADIKPSYVYSNKNVFTRGHYIFYFDDIYKKALEDGYVIIVDGSFDCINLIQEGFNAVSLLGSIINDYVLFILSFITRIYIAYDNDEAGLMLKNTVKKHFPNACEIRQGVCKDIDGLLKSKYKEEFKRFLAKGVKENIGMDLAFKCKDLY